MRFKREALAYMGLLATFILWGSLYVASQIVMKELPTFTVAFLRFLLAWTFLTVLELFNKKTINPFSVYENLKGDTKKYVWILGFFGYTLSVGVQLLGTRLAGSTTASLINSTNPVTITLMAALILKEGLKPNKIVGILLALVGVYFIIGGDTQINILGASLSVLAVFGWSFVSVITRRASKFLSPLQITRHAVGIAAFCNIPICIAEILITGWQPHLSLSAILCLIYMGVCCTGVTYVLWNRSLSILPASNCSAFYPLQPLTSALLGIVVFKERLTLAFLTGGLLIVIGILICLLGDRIRQRTITKK